jgi:surfeit locus 1 family protein
VELNGILYIPPEKVFVLGEGEDRNPGWPKVLQRIRLDLQQTQLGYPLLPVVLLLDPDQPHGFVRDWRPVVFGPERHVGYAFQWFSLATALVIIYLILNIRRVTRRNSSGGAAP